MKKTTKFLALFGLALFMAGCSEDDNVNESALSKDGTVQFGVQTTQMLTRATSGGTLGVIDNEDDLIKKQGFGVFGCYTGALVYESSTVTPDFMYNQQVNGEKVGSDYIWSYNPVKYWPNNGKTTFFAYAPYVDHTKVDYEKPWKTACIADMSKPYDEGDPWLVYVLSPYPFSNPALNQGQCDLLIGVNAANSDNPWYDQEKANLTDKMNFTFKHALGIIGDKIKIKVTPELQAVLDASSNARVYIRSITMNYRNLTRKAKLVLNSKQGIPNWKPIVSGEVTVDRTVTIKESDIVSVDPSYSEFIATEDYDDQTYYNANEGITSANTGTDGVTLLTKKGLLFIPYQVVEQPQQVEVVLDYQVLANEMEPYNGVVKNTINIQTQDGQCSDIIITLGKNLHFDVIKAPKIGDFYYSDGTWGQDNHHDTGAVPIGTIVYLGDKVGTYDPATGAKGTAKHGLVMAFQNTAHTFSSYPYSTKYNRWGPYGDFTELPNCGTFAAAYENDLNGEYNTNVLFNRWTVVPATQTDNYWASWDCAQYSTAGVGSKGRWHIGTFGEWALIFDQIGKKFGGGSGTDIADAIAGSTITDGMVFYPSLTGQVEGSMIENLESNNSEKFWMFDPGFEGHLDRNKLQNGLRYWTSTEVGLTKAMSFEFKYQPVPNYSDGVMFFLDSGCDKESQYLIRPLLTF